MEAFLWFLVPQTSSPDFGVRWKLGKSVGGKGHQNCGNKLGLKTEGDQKVTDSKRNVTVCKAKIRRCVKDEEWIEE